MIQNDILGVVLVYGYVAVLLVFTGKNLSKKYPILGRKILHIMVGNVAFLLPIFQTREIMAFVAAAPFIILTFLMSPYSPITSIKDRLSASGHQLGLVYYAIAWTILAYVFFAHKEVIAIGILAMSYGDGFASVVGIKYGTRIYKVFDDRKSIEGSIVMMCCTFILCGIALWYYAIPFSGGLIAGLILLSGIAAVVEGVTPRGLDNLSVPFVTSCLYWYLIYHVGFFG